MIPLHTTSLNCAFRDNPVETWLHQTPRESLHAVPHIPFGISNAAQPTVAIGALEVLHPSFINARCGHLMRLPCWADVTLKWSFVTIVLGSAAATQNPKRKVSFSARCDALRLTTSNGRNEESHFDLSQPTDQPNDNNHARWVRPRQHKSHVKWVLMLLLWFFDVLRSCLACLICLYCN